jgi:hypothetical protein
MEFLFVEMSMTSWQPPWTDGYPRTTVKAQREESQSHGIEEESR